MFDDPAYHQNAKPEDQADLIDRTVLSLQRKLRSISPPVYLHAEYAQLHNLSLKLRGHGTAPKPPQVDREPALSAAREGDFLAINAGATKKPDAV